jgi:hypothetical protein
VRGELHTLGAYRTHGGAHESRLAACGAAKNEADVLGLGTRELGERWHGDRQQLRVRAAVRALARDGLRLFEAPVLVYINRHVTPFFSVYSNRISLVHAMPRKPAFGQVPIVTPA